uniref:Uncharacterized protein n=1 Tax=Candidatus Kentrum sp. DK TaxID=2126562 RepID=A0A450SRE2_9GAMM|nr:MAG: hypothetical protein BECKDK2373B_GA0170837_10588 [Candidatus Kentron sp. DK]
MPAPENTTANTELAAAPFSTWIIPGFSIAVVASAAALYPIDKIISSVFFVLAVLIGTFGAGYAYKGKDKGALFVSSSAAIAITILLMPLVIIPALSYIFPTAWKGDSAPLIAWVVIFSAAIPTIIALLVLWKGKTSAPSRPPPDDQLSPGPAPEDTAAAAPASSALPAPRLSAAPAPLPDWLYGAPAPLGERFVGREGELDELDAAWESALSDKPFGLPTAPGRDPAPSQFPSSPVRTVGIIAWGGFGKSTLARQWLWRRFEKGNGDIVIPGAATNAAPGTIPATFGDSADANAASADALFWYDFQEGKGADAFAEALLRYVTDTPDFTLDASLKDTSRRLEVLRRTLAGRRYLMVLDGLEVEQDASGGEGLGRMNTPFLREFLRAHTAGLFGKGLILITSRLPLKDLDDFSGPYHAIDLESQPLKDAEVALLLKKEGVRELPEQELGELIDISGRQPLALKTLAGILARHNGGSALGWRRFDDETFVAPPGREGERQLWRVLDWTDRLLEAPERRLMTVIGHFREPVRQDWLYHLLAPAEAPALTPRSAPEPPPEWAERELSEEQKKLLLADLETGQAPFYPPEELRLPGPELAGPRLRQALDTLTGLQLLRREDLGAQGQRYSAHQFIRAHFRRPCEADGSRNSPAPHQTGQEANTAPCAPGLTATDIHLRLYRLYTAVIQPQWRPDGREGLRPLYEAVYHGAKAGLHQAALDEVYIERILRGTGHDGNYSTFKLGAIESDLAAIANFFDQPWDRPSARLKSNHQAWLLNQAAFSLRALGRPRAALAPMAAGVAMAEKEENWRNAAISAGNLSELEITLGDVARAVADGARAVAFADRSGDAFQRISKRTTHAEALAQGGEEEKARQRFVEAEERQKEDQPEYPRLYSLQGFQYADLLLAAAERGAWRAWLGGEGNAGHPDGAPDGTAWEILLTQCEAVSERAEETLAWVSPQNWLLDIGLDNLTLARAGLYRALLAAGATADSPAEERAPAPPAVRLPEGLAAPMAAAVDKLREAGTMNHLPRALLTRAEIRAVAGDRAGAEADLAEAWGIADGGDMGLFRADILLTRARLLFREDRAGARQDLAEARRLIAKHGYHRRDRELAMAMAVIGAGPVAVD